MASEALGLCFCIMNVSGPGAQQELHGHLGEVYLASPSSYCSVTLRSTLGNLHSAGSPSLLPGCLCALPISHPKLSLSPLERFLSKAQPQSHHSPDSKLPVAPCAFRNQSLPLSLTFGLTLLRPMAPSAQNLSASFFVPACFIPKTHEALLWSFPWDLL